MRNRGEGRKTRREKGKGDEIVPLQKQYRYHDGSFPHWGPDPTFGVAPEGEYLIKVTLYTRMLHSQGNLRLSLMGPGSGRGLRRIPSLLIKPCLSGGLWKHLPIHACL